MPKERFGSASSIHSYFLQWLREGFFLQLWRAGLAEYDELEGIAWEWQSIDGAMIKAPLAQEAVGPNPTDRGKKWKQRHVLVDEHGIPLSIVVTGANRHDVSQREAVLDAIVIDRPQEVKQHLCADKGYHGDPARESIETRDYVPHVRQRGEETEAKKTIPRYKPHRWIGEVAHSWFNRFMQRISQRIVFAGLNNRICLLDP